MTQKQNAPATTPQPLPLVLRKGEPRIDSRLLAQRLGTKHKSLLERVRKYEAEMKDFGKLPFQTAPLPGSATGQKERFALLNEGQAFFMLTLSRNTPRIVALKAGLVHAFSQARRAAQIHQQDYLPTYHQTHHALAGLEADPGHQRHLHMNVNKLLNKAAGIEAGQRANAQPGSLSLLTVAQMMAAKAASAAPNGKAAYAQIKQAVQPLQQLALQVEVLPCSNA